MIRLGTGVSEQTHGRIGPIAVEGPPAREARRRASITRPRPLKNHVQSMPRYLEQRQTAIWNGRVRGVEQRPIPLFASSCIFMMSALPWSAP
ncbi:hypothetical protein [Sorangium sp. So ce1151]|uniref:hypothetical protein n=1 Tax=Sorangium sp. So ce1151 TaxID=3133332 RepID=UPI003F60C62C